MRSLLLALLLRAFFVDVAEPVPLGGCDLVRPLGDTDLDLDTSLARTAAAISASSLRVASVRADCVMLLLLPALFVSLALVPSTSPVLTSESLAGELASSVAVMVEVVADVELVGAELEAAALVGVVSSRLLTVVASSPWTAGNVAALEPLCCCCVGVWVATTSESPFSGVELEAAPAPVAETAGIAVDELRLFDSSELAVVVAESDWSPAGSAVVVSESITSLSGSVVVSTSPIMLVVALVVVVVVVLVVV